MEDYLNNYCSYISNSKKSISITNSDEYISTQEFDVEIIAKHYEPYINLKSIFNLLVDNQYYAGHSEAEKHKLLIQSFEILYNYSKNLLANFSIYSTKSIQEVNTNIKDFLGHLPRFSDYLSTLLGYEFDPVKREWSIKQKSLSRQRRLHLAAVCVLCTYARSYLSETEVMDNEQSDSATDHEENNISINNGDTSSTKWQCDMCGVLNSARALNCEVCYTTRSLPEEPPQSLPISKSSASRQVSDSSCWECSCCTFMNPLDNYNCGVCGTGNLQAGFDSGWKCERCNYRNASEDQTCSTCGEARHRGDSMHSQGRIMDKNESLINDFDERFDRVNKPDKALRQINNSNPHLHEIGYNHFNRKASPPQGARIRGGGGKYPGEEISDIDYRIDIEKKPERHEKENLQNYADMKIDRSNKKYEVNNEDTAHKPKRAIDNREKTIDKYNTREEKPKRSIDNRERTNDKYSTREDKVRVDAPTEKQKHNSHTRGSAGAPQINRPNKTPTPSTGRNANNTKERKSASNSPKTPEKVSPEHRGDRVQKQDKKQGVTDPDKCNSCDLDKKGRLFDKTMERIKKCPVCHRRGKHWFWGKCFGKF